jgi:hypothetical protein
LAAKKGKERRIPYANFTNGREAKPGRESAEGIQRELTFAAMAFIKRG